MAPVPTRDGDMLACPQCEALLVRKKAPFSLQGKLIGEFDSIVCEKCGYSLLTSTGYDEALKEARKYDLVGPEEEFIVPESKELLQMNAIPPIVASTESSSEFVVAIYSFVSDTQPREKSKPEITLIEE